MGRNEKYIPLEDIKGLKTLIGEGKSHQEISNYYGVERSTISKKIKREVEKGNLQENMK